MDGPRSNRRDLLKKAAVGGAVVWTAPIVLSASPASAGSPPPGCSIVPFTVAISCGPEDWRVRTSLDTTACPGAIVQLEAIDDIVLSGDCAPIVGWYIFSSSDRPFTISFTVTLRNACDGTVLAGPQVIFVDAGALCAGPGDEPGAPVPRSDTNQTITVTFGDRTIEIPAGG